SFRIHHSASRTGPSAVHSTRPSAKYLGQWYDVTAHSKAPWLGFRLCGIHGRLSLSGLGNNRSLSVPFALTSARGDGWVRLNRDKNGCDVILVKAGSSAANGKSCSWKVSSGGGRTIGGGTVKIENKTLRPFAPPQSRIK